MTEAMSGVSSLRIMLLFARSHSRLVKHILLCVGSHNILLYWFFVSDSIIASYQEYPSYAFTIKSDFNQLTDLYMLSRVLKMFTDIVSFSQRAMKLLIILCRYCP